MLDRIEHVVVLILENRSFDQLLGLLYATAGNVSPGGAAFDGLTGHETNPDANGNPVRVFPIKAGRKYAYFTPGADPGEGFQHTNAQLFGVADAPRPPAATCNGFVKDFAEILSPGGQHVGKILPGTVPGDIMGTFPPAMVPVLSGLARGYAVSDRWFSSVPTETLPNRAFALAATSLGAMDDKTRSFDTPSILGRLSDAGVSWAIYGYDTDPLTRHNFPDTLAATEDHFGQFADFTRAAASDALAAFSFLEPSWGPTGNSQHPNYDVSSGEQLIHDVYYALRDGPGWNETLLVVTYDEHGGCYDHVSPPQGSTPPDASVGEFGFDFTRFGVRVPTVLVSPLIAPGTVFRAPDGAVPLDHTSILKTVEERWSLPALTARDAAARDVGGVLTLATPRSDDPLAGVVVPRSQGPSPHFDEDPPSHLQQVHAELVSRLPLPGEPPALTTAREAERYIRERMNAWKAGRKRSRG